MRKKTALKSDYPAPVPPETWGMDDVFTRLLGRQEKLWRGRGYQWEWALEIEFTPQTSDEFEFFLKQSKVALRDGFPIEREIRNAFHQYQDFKIANVEPDTVFAQEMLDKIIADYRDPDKQSDLAKYLSHPKINSTVEEAAAELEEIDARLKDATDKLTSLAKSKGKDELFETARINYRENLRFAVSDIMLAFLHHYPSKEGGLADLIEPRFGSYGYGHGWWDGPGTAEVRLTPRDAKSLIADYHIALENITEAAKRFGVIANFASAQLNVNIRRLSDGKNMMLIEDDADVDFHKRILAGIFRLSDEVPHIRSDFRSTDARDEMLGLSAGNSKLFGINLRPERWEMRRSSNNGYMHLSRELAFFMTGAAYGAFEIKNIERYINRSKLMIKDYVVPITVNPYHRASSAAEVVSNSYIMPDGRLRPDNSVIHSYAEGLLRELGEENAQRHVFPIDNQDEEMGSLDLRGSSAWSFIFEYMKLNDDNRLEMEQLHPELQAMFERFDITGRRRIVKAETITPLYGTATLKNNTYLIEESPILKAYISENDRFSLEENIKAILDQRETRHALEISGRLQYDLKERRDMADQIGDALERLNALSGKTSDDAPDTSSDVTIENSVFSALIKPHLDERWFAQKQVERTVTAAMLKKFEPRTLSENHQMASRLKDQSKIVAADLRESAEKLRRDHPGDNRLPMLCEDFNKAADYIEQKAQDSRFYAEKIVERTVTRVRSSVQDGSFDPTIALTRSKIIYESFLDATIMALRDERFTPEDCASMFEESCAIASAAFHKAAATPANIEHDRLAQRVFTLIGDSLDLTGHDDAKWVREAIDHIIDRQP